MGTGWRRAFCTTIPRDRETTISDKQQTTSPSPSPSPRRCAKLGFFSSASNPSTPRLPSQNPNLRCRTNTVDSPSTNESPAFHCKTAPKITTATRNPKSLLSSNPSSPRSPLKLSLFKNSFKFRSSCGICLNSVKRGQGTAIYTAECAHAFHFPCIASYVRARFNPIPEADESVDEDDDGVEEFQGFFPTHSTSVVKSDEVSINDRDFSRNVQVRLLPEVAVISVGRGYETYAVALRVKAPPPLPSLTTRNSSNSTASLLDPSRRAPIDLITVLDVSASMTGAKLQMLKRAMRLVISSLGSADRLSIVAFSSSPKRLLPLKRMTPNGQRSARRIIDRLVCGQGSSVGEALRKATKVLEDRRERNPVASIMLLSDGQDERVSDNNSNHRHTSIHKSSTRFAHIEIPVHSFGFGQSGGNSQEPAEDAFAKCVGGLLSVVVQDLRIQLGFASSSAPAEIVAVYPCNSRPNVLGSGSVRLGDLYAEEERELLVELRVPQSAVGSHHVMSARCLYKDPATQEVVYDRDQSLLVPRPHALPSTGPKIQHLSNLFINNFELGRG
ncbi:hypothetical protein D5086_022392 [Populus alba]|uniref:Uncharacterized protein n=1 Tax=Populus alba TaxID=43335 RepID=A0ACC4BEW2_POPAL